MIQALTTLVERAGVFEREALPEAACQQGVAFPLKSTKRSIAWCDPGALSSGTRAKRYFHYNGV